MDSTREVGGGLREKVHLTSKTMIEVLVYQNSGTWCANGDANKKETRVLVKSDSIPAG